MLIPQYFLHQLIAILPINLMAIEIGIAAGWVAPIINSLRRPNAELTLTTEDCSWIASLNYAGRMAGPFLTAYFLDKVGCNKILALGALFMFLPWIVIALTRSVLPLCIARFMLGFARGIVEMAYVIYASENNSKNLRGVFGNMVIGFGNLGLILGFALPTFFSYAAVANINVALGLLTLLSVSLLKEPAQFLIVKGAHAKAERNFFWLRGRDTNTRKEFDDVKKYALEESSKSLQLRELLANEKNRKTCRVVFVVTVLVYATGWSALNSVITVALKSAKDSLANQLTILYGVFQLLLTFLAALCVERVDRRTLMLTASILCAILQATTGALYCVQDHITHFSWLVFATTTAYAAICTAILLPLSFTIRGELLSQNVKVTCGSVTTVVSSAVSLVQSQIFLPISETYGFQANFFAYAAVAFLLTVYAYFELPETRGMSLVEIQKSLVESNKKNSVVASAREK